MRSPSKVLSSLSEHSKLPEYRYERLYRVLFNEEMYYVAYQEIYAKAGNMTQGADGKTIDEMSLSRISKLICTLKNETYQPYPAKRAYIPKKNGKMRPLGIPSFDDKILQEVIRMVLEAIYEQQFEDCSHGFRPQRSCHTAISKIKMTFAGTKWFIEGDIKGFFDNINHDILTTILKERISDDRFIRLIRKFLNAGYIEEWTFHKTYSGTPQGGIISPILANIYLDKLDKHMKEYVQIFDKGKRHKKNPLQMALENRRKVLIRKLKVEKDEAEIAGLLSELKEIRDKRIKTQSLDEMDSDYKRLKYVRYADDFLIGIIGSLEDCKHIKQNIGAFLQGKLRLELSEEKTLITHAHQVAKFLSFDINILKTNDTKRDTLGRLTRCYNKKVAIKMPKDAIKKKLLEYEAVEFKHRDGKEYWKPKTRTYLINNDDLEILTTYNAELRGFYNYYSIAVNCCRIQSLKHIMEFSMYRTFACKYRTTIRRICRQYQVNGNFSILYKNKKGEQRMQVLYNKGFKTRTETKYFSETLPQFFAGRTSLIDRLSARECELCGATR
jgi:group II intron reverse transcriptase/maturase